MLYIERVGYKTPGQTYIHSLTAISLCGSILFGFFKIFMLNFYFSSAHIFQKFYNKMFCFVKRKISILSPSCFLKGCFLSHLLFPLTFLIDNLALILFFLMKEIGAAKLKDVPKFLQLRYYRS